jgi:hypothetical protein
MGAALKGRNAAVQLLVDRGAKLEQEDHGSRDTDKIGSWPPDTHGRHSITPKDSSASACSRRPPIRRRPRSSAG